jgi:hypothetical protein
MPDPTEIDRETPGAQTLRRGLSILKLLARYQAGGGIGVSEIARKLELSKATTVRLTRTLMDEQFVAQDVATRRYQLGPESFAVGLAAEPNYALQRSAAPFLRALALETGDWVFFTVRHGLEAICLSRESGDIPYRFSACGREPSGMNGRVGSLPPAWEDGAHISRNRRLQHDSTRCGNCCTRRANKGMPSYRAPLPPATGGLACLCCDPMEIPSRRWS